MNKKIALFSIVLVLLFSAFSRTPFIPPVRAAKTWIVDDDGPSDFHTVQEAIDIANVGDTIFVRAGTYYEHVILSKSVSLVGENRTSTIIDGNGTGTIIYVKANKTVVSSLTIRNSGLDWHNKGIHLNHSFNSSVSGNNINNNFFGIWVDECCGNMINSNDVSNNQLGVGLNYSYNNILRNNNITDNGANFGVGGLSLEHFIHDIDISNTVDGRPLYYLVNQESLVVNPFTYASIGYLALINSTNITVEDLTLTNNGQGVLLAHTTSSSIENVTATDNTAGITLASCFSCSVSRNDVTNNLYGVYVYGSSNCSLLANNVTTNILGVLLCDSSNNSIAANNVSNNGRLEPTVGYGIFLDRSSNNNFHHNNLINNTNQVDLDEISINTWDDGYPSGGNYWSDYVGIDEDFGPCQNNTGSDGIGDTPYVIATNNVDKYPLMAPVKTFGVMLWDEREYEIEILSNSTVTNFEFNMSLIPEYASTISFDVIGPELKGVFCRITIPNIIVQGFWNDKYIVLSNGEPWPFKNWADNTNTYIYFMHQHATHQIIIIPEFRSVLFLPLFMSLTMFALILAKIRLRRKLKA